MKAWDCRVHSCDQPTQPELKALDDDKKAIGANFVIFAMRFANEFAPDSIDVEHIECDRYYDYDDVVTVDKSAATTSKWHSFFDEGISLKRAIRKSEKLEDAKDLPLISRMWRSNDDDHDVGDDGFDKRGDYKKARRRKKVKKKKSKKKKGMNKCVHFCFACWHALPSHMLHTYTSC